MMLRLTLDTTIPVTEGAKEILITLLEAIGLVVLVVFLFLQNWRATLIPILTIPVSLVGAFMFFPMVGFTTNTLSLLGLVLAVGLVVDDAIVVVEAIEAKIEQGRSPRDAALEAMEEVGGALVGIALVLSAVFIPAGLITGITGSLYRQFALTIAFSVLLSAFNALTLSPALGASSAAAAQHEGGERPALAILCSLQQDVRVCAARLPPDLRFPDPQGGFGPGAARCVHGVRRGIRKDPAAIVLTRRRSGLLPDERPAAAGRIVAAYRRDDEEDRRDSQERAGNSLLQRVLGLQPPLANEQRPKRRLLLPARSIRRAKTRDLSSSSIIASLNKKLAALPEAQAFALLPPAIPASDRRAVSTSSSRIEPVTPSITSGRTLRSSSRRRTNGRSSGASPRRFTRGPAALRRGR